MADLLTCLDFKECIRLARPDRVQPVSLMPIAFTVPLALPQGVGFDPETADEKIATATQQS